MCKASHTRRTMPDGPNHQFFLQVEVHDPDSWALPEAMLVITAQAAIMDAFKEQFGIRPEVTILALGETGDS